VIHTLASIPRVLSAEGVRRGAETASHVSEQAADHALAFVSNLGVLLVCAGIIVAVWRIVKGPSLVDRAIAGDVLALHVVALVILVTIRFGSLVLFDAVLIVSILGFVSTVATAQYIGRKRSAT